VTRIDEKSFPEGPQVLGGVLTVFVFGLELSGPGCIPAMSGEKEREGGSSVKEGRGRKNPQAAGGEFTASFSEAWWGGR